MTTDCPICKEPRRIALEVTVLDDVNASLAKCDSCGLLGADRAIWLDRAYSDVIPPVDTGVMARNLFIADLCVALFGSEAPPDIVDLGGGFGVLVRRLRDLGFDARWSDPHADNVLARGFEADERSRYDIAIAVEVLEHVEDPLAWIEQQRARYGFRSLLLTTELLPEPVPDPEWWYLTPETGQHITFLERRTLTALATKLGMHLRTRRNLHLLSMSPYPIGRWFAATTRAQPLLRALAGRSMRPLTDADSSLSTRRDR